MPLAARVSDLATRIAQEFNLRLRGTRVRSTADAVPTSTTYVDVPGLSLPIPAGETWALELDAHTLGASTSTGVNLQLVAVGPAVIASATSSGMGIAGTVATPHAGTTAVAAAGFNKSTTRAPVRIIWTVTMGATGGTVKVQAASSGAGTTRVYAGAVLSGGKAP